MSAALEVDKQRLEGGIVGVKFDNEERRE